MTLQLPAAAPYLFTGVKLSVSYGFIAVIAGTPTGKVYVTSPDALFMTVIYTDTDSVGTHIPLQGYGVRVLMTSP